MANPEFIKTYDAGAAIPPYTIVKADPAADFQVIPAAAQTDAIMGVTTEIAAVTGERCDVIHGGVAYVKVGPLGISAGSLVTSDANGNAVAGGSGFRNLGVARQSGPAGAVVEVIISLS